MQFQGNALVGTARCHQPQHLQLALGQVQGLILVLAHPTGHQGRNAAAKPARFAGRRAAHGLDNGLHGFIFDQVAVDAQLQQFNDVRTVVVTT